MFNRILAFFRPTVDAIVADFTSKFDKVVAVQSELAKAHDRVISIRQAAKAKAESEVAKAEAIVAKIKALFNA